MDADPKFYALVGRDPSVALDYRPLDFNGAVHSLEGPQAALEELGPGASPALQGRAGQSAKSLIGEELCAEGGVDAGSEALSAQGAA